MNTVCGISTHPLGGVGCTTGCAPPRIVSARNIQLKQHVRAMCWPPPTPLWIVRVGGDDWELRPWHYVCEGCVNVKESEGNQPPLLRRSHGKTTSCRTRPWRPASSGTRPCVSRLQRTCRTTCATWWTRTTPLSRTSACSRFPFYPHSEAETPEVDLKCSSALIEQPPRAGGKL